MRLQPVPADELDESWLRWRPVEPRFRPTPGGRLTALRRSVFENALAAIKPGRPIKVTTYVFADLGVDTDGTHALLAEHARERGWSVDRERFTDEPTGGSASTRPQFNLAVRRAGSGFVDGVLALGRDSMPSTDEAYEAYLHWLHRHYAFIAFLQPTTGRTQWRQNAGNVTSDHGGRRS
ncbi:recombinase family protein [Streptomyces roseochromogenus]|nr:recombinase family protein [Streptomyces roseochromogenus]